MADADWTPTVPGVGALLRARTTDTDGSELGTFSDDTRPTSEQVVELFPQAQSDVHDTVGDVPPAYYAQARALASLGTALLIELSYFPEQVAAGRSPYDQLKKIYDERLSRLKTLIASATTNVPGAQGPVSDFVTDTPYAGTTPW